MKQEWQIYIKGNSSRGDEVINILKQHGGKPIRPDAISGTIDAAIYYIDHDGIITFSTVDKETAKIIMDKYREIKLPEKWNYGDILINLKTKDFAVYRKDDDFRKESFRDEVYVKNDGIVIFRNYLHRNDDFSLATDEETQQFYELLHKHHKDWDAEKKQLVDWKWKPKLNEIYWHICSDGRLVSNTFENDEFDIGLYNFGNCFRTHEEAKVMVEKIKKLLKA